MEFDITALQRSVGEMSENGEIDKTNLARRADKIDDEGHADGSTPEMDRFRNEDQFEVPVQLTDIDQWINYTDDDLYFMDKRIRAFLKSIRYRKQVKGGYQTTAPLVFQYIYGRKPGPGDGSLFKMLHPLLVYYCTNYKGPTTYKGRKVSRVYTFSKYAAINKRAYSLRLRMEESKEGADVFREGPDSKKDKRAYGRRADSKSS